MNEILNFIGFALLILSKTLEFAFALLFLCFLLLYFFLIFPVHGAMKLIYNQQKKSRHMDGM